MKAELAWIAITSCLLTLAAVWLALNLASGEKKVERQVERLYATDDPQFSRAHGRAARAADRRRQQGRRAAQRRRRSSRRCSRRSARRGARITFETYIYWSETIGQRVRRCAGRARARRRQGARAARLGRQRQDGRSAISMQMKQAGVEVERYHKPHWSRPAPHEQSHPPQAAGGRRRRSASPAASASPTSGAATRRTPSTGATPTFESRARWSRRCRRCSWTTGSRRPARCCTATQYFPALKSAWRAGRADVQQLAHRRQREHAPDVPDGDHCRQRTASSCPARTSCRTSWR